jgi:hypothetical protein
VKIYLIRDPMLIGRFARYTYSGTWTQGGLCPRCREGTSKLIPPLLLEWQEGSDVLGDFAWAGGSYRPVITETARQALRFLDPDVEWGEVQVVPPERKRARHKRIPYPYTGPPLWFIIPRQRVFMDREQAKRLLCPGCGEYVGPTWLTNIKLSRAEVGPHRLFRLAENGRSSAMFVTEEAAQRIREANLQNVALVEAGEIVD